MVLSGLLFQRVLARAVIAAVGCVSLATLPFAGAGAAPAVPQRPEAEPGQVAGTMPEDYLPQLRDILAHAMRRSPEMVAKEFDRVMQEARVTMAKSARLPSLGGNFDYGITETAISANTDSRSRNTGAQYGFSLGQALFHWGAIKNETEIARLNLALVDKDTARVYREMSVALRKAYLALIVEKARVLQAKRALEIVVADVKVAETKKNDGTISGGALAAEQLREREVRLGVLRAESEFAANRRRFTQAAGLPELREEDLPADIPQPEYREPLATELAARTLRDNAKGTIEWEIHDLRLHEAKLRRKIVDTRLLPKFGLSASYGLRNNTNVNNNVVSSEAVTEQRIGVGGYWNIFDGFATRGAKREAAVSSRALEHRQAIEMERLLQNVQSLERTLKLDVEHLALVEIRQGTAEEGRKLLLEGVQLGNVAKADVARADVNVLKTTADTLEARALFLTHWSEFVAATGADPVLKNLPDRHVFKKK